MAASMTGMALHGGVVPVGGTFFVFSDYARPAIRLAALSEAHVIYFFTHDSIGLGEDGPTHQPIEQLASLRAMPGLRLIRPADAKETAAAWKIAVDSGGPTALVLSRQDLPVLAETSADPAEGVGRGAYVLVAGETMAELPTSFSSAPAARSSTVSARRSCSGREASLLASCLSRAGTCSPRRRRATVTASCSKACPASPSKREPPSAGSATPTRRSRSTASAHRRRAE